jgi:hypothetical protein
MKSKLLFLTFAIILMLSATAFAQHDTTLLKTDTTLKKTAPRHAMNLFKINLTALVITNFSLQYERIINKRLSFALGFGNRPVSSLPYKNTIVNALADDPEMQSQINNMTFGSTCITPEFRFYVGKKGYGNGFYFAPFYRYATYTGNGVEFTYDNNLAKQNTLTMSGKITGNTFGLLLGVQKSLGKHICLDFYFGPNYGTGKGDFTGKSSTPLTPEEQDDLRQTLENFEIPLTDKTITVNANGANLKLDGPFGGIRAGFAIGVKF